MSQNTTSNTSHFNCPNCHCTEIIIIWLQCYCHTGNMFTRDNQRVLPVGQIISHPPIIQQNSYSNNPTTHLAVNAETPRAISTATILQNPYSYNQINHPATSPYPPQAISSAQYENYSNFFNHNQERQHMSEYNPEHSFAPHNISSPNTNNVTTFANNTNPGFVQESSSGIYAQHTNVSVANQFVDIGAEINYGEGPSLYSPSC